MLEVILAYVMVEPVGWRWWLVASSVPIGLFLLFSRVCYYSLPIYNEDRTKIHFSLLEIVPVHVLSNTNKNSHVVDYIVLWAIMVETTK